MTLLTVLLLTVLGDERGKLLLLFNRIREGIKAPALIFVQNKEKAKSLYRQLILESVVPQNRIEYISTQRLPQEVLE
jgi:hypothetical protein